MIATLSQIARRILTAYREAGLLETSRLILINLWGLPGQLWRALWKSEFDRLYGSDTSKPVDRSALAGPHTVRAAIGAYEVTPAGAFREMLRAAAVDHRRFTFVDLGSGKGRTLMIAATYPFRAVIGVELSPILVDIAMTNIAKIPLVQRMAESIQCQCADARQFTYPDAPILVYLFNPFEEEILSPVLQKLHRSYDRNPRAIVIIYAEPKHVRLLRNASWLKKFAEGRYTSESKGRRYKFEIYKTTQSEPTPRLAGAR